MSKNVVSVSLATLLLLSVPAAADEPPEPPWKINLRREALMRDGAALARRGQWADAREHFRKAVDIRSHPRALLWLGYSDEQLGHLVQAKAIYELARNDARAVKLKAEERDANETLAALEPKIPRITLRVPADVEATVWLDGKPVDAGKGAVLLDPGKHQVTAQAPGRVRFTRDLVLAPGDDQLVEVDLRPTPPRKEAIPPAPPPSPRSTMGPVAIGVAGLGLTAIGGPLLAIGGKTGHVDKPTLATGGTMVALGAGAGVAALVWGLRYHGATSTRSAPTTLVAAAPLSGGGWAKVQGRF